MIALRNIIGNLTSKKKEVIYPKSDFRISIIRSDKCILFATFNQSYLNFSQKQLYPWQAKVTIKINKLKNDQSISVEELYTLKSIENSFKNLFENYCTSHFVGRVTRKNYRDIYFYLENFDIKNLKIRHQIKSLSEFGNVALKFKKDKNWADITNYFESVNNLNLV